MKNEIKEVKFELYNDHFQNYKRHNIRKAQLVIADIPYNIGINAQAEINEINQYGFSPTLMDKAHPTLFKGLKLP